jgi:hypothetical protein
MFNLDDFYSFDSYLNSVLTYPVLWSRNYLFRLQLRLRLSKSFCSGSGSGTGTGTGSGTGSGTD